MVYKFATNWKRFLSFLIDVILLNVIITKPLSSLLKNQIPETLEELMTFDFRSIFLITLLISIINVIYWIILEYKIQQTLGSYIFKIQVKAEDNNLTLSKVISRNITKISSILLIIDAIGIFTSNKKQRFTEKLSKTVTIENG